MLSQDQVTEIIELLETLDTSTKIYFGCDSVRRRHQGEWFADFATVVIIHMNGKNGCRLFSDLSTERDYDDKKNRPHLRMMNETRKVCDLYIQLIPYIENFAEVVEDKNGNIIIKEFNVEVHLDISTNPLNGSNCAAKEAAGYVLAMTNLSEDQVKLKPDAFAASFGADKMAHIGHKNK